MAKRFGRDLWERLVEQVKDDRGPAFESKGMWTAKKLYFVCEYLEQVARGMSGHPKFPDGLCYVDLFSGTGLTRARREDGTIGQYPGSPLIAASTPKPFTKLILVDRDPAALAALRPRIERSGYAGQVEYLEVDCNSDPSRIAKLIPRRALNVCFVDPFSLDINYDTIASLAKERALDLIILFCDRFDLGRNVHEYYKPNEDDTKLDRFLGYRGWREELQEVVNQTGARVREFFATVYLRQLASIGYDQTDSWPLEGPMGPAFRLIFASKDPLGLKFCRIAQKQDFEGNTGLFPV